MVSTLLALASISDLVYFHELGDGIFFGPIVDRDRLALEKKVSDKGCTG